ncbi:MAG: hypothetical protein MI864_28170 [Pseudomonadales bacterium]|nr:hypothetical protein [Pseudomonadales bacterium]
MSEVGALNNQRLGYPNPALADRNSDAARDGRRSVSQFESPDLTQNDTIDRGNAPSPLNNGSANTVNATNGSSDSNAARRAAQDGEAFDRAEANVRALRSSEDQTEARREANLQETAAAFERQLQRSALERASSERIQQEEQVEAQQQSEVVNVAPPAQSLASQNPERAESDETNSTSGQASGTSGVEAPEQSRENDAFSDIRERITSETAESALGLNVNTVS